MSRKPLDLELLNNELQEKRNGGPIRDHDISRAMAQIDNLVSDSNQFVIVEEDAEVLITSVQHELPSDDEIEQMKQEYAEQDRIERERWVNSLPWWKRILVQLGVIRYERIRR
jgi:hypothetical protein